MSRLRRIGVATTNKALSSLEHGAGLDVGKLPGDRARPRVLADLPGRAHRRPRAAGSRTASTGRGRGGTIGPRPAARTAGACRRSVGHRRRGGTAGSSGRVLSRRSHPAHGQVALDVGHRRGRRPRRRRPRRSSRKQLPHVHLLVLLVAAVTCRSRRSSRSTVSTTRSAAGSTAARTSLGEADAVLERAGWQPTTTIRSTEPAQRGHQRHHPTRATGRGRRASPRAAGRRRPTRGGTSGSMT